MRVQTIETERKRSRNSLTCRGFPAFLLAFLILWRLAQSVFSWPCTQQTCALRPAKSRRPMWMRLCSSAQQTWRLFSACLVPSRKCKRPAIFPNFVTKQQFPELNNGNKHLQILREVPDRKKTGIGKPRNPEKYPQTLRNKVKQRTKLNNFSFQSSRSFGLARTQQQYLDYITRERRIPCRTSNMESVLRSCYTSIVYEPVMAFASRQNTPNTKGFAQR
eukprot:1633774-Amphidinium_carterae.2